MIVMDFLLPGASKSSHTSLGGFKFIPLYNPSRSVPSPITFSEDELQRFEVRFENGYDLTHDSQYYRWLKMYHSMEGRQV